MQNTLNKIAEKNSLTLQGFKPLSGGDINAVYVLKCTEGNFVVKLNDAAKFPDMFKAEAKGLQLLASSESFTIPKVLSTGEEKSKSYLLLENIPKGTKNVEFWPFFAENLAKLHRTTQNNFGLEHDNYIGSLKQVNGSEKTSADFYIQQRLKPQFALAKENGFSFQNIEQFYATLSAEIPNEPPSLIHGDLWNGNYLVSGTGKPVLIDPAVAFASREMDLAMMQLFGGFPEEVFSVYNEIYALDNGWERRIPLFQLYYVLVHLNIFGRGYLPQVQTILHSLG
tara:strand:- start:71542 stop:72387 length:846 start_codon:yes stop_codon:yes gene_type:complete